MKVESKGLVKKAGMGKRSNSEETIYRRKNDGYAIQYTVYTGSVRLHDLRYAYATMPVKRGHHPKFVQELLGHVTISQTLDTYSHVLPGMSDGLADAMDDALA